MIANRHYERVCGNRRSLVGFIWVVLRKFQRIFPVRLVKLYLFLAEDRLWVRNSELVFGKSFRPNDRPGIFWNRIYGNALNRFRNKVWSQNEKIYTGLRVRWCRFPEKLRRTDQIHETSVPGRFLCILLLNRPVLRHDSLGKAETDCEKSAELIFHNMAIISE